MRKTFFFIAGILLFLPVSAFTQTIPLPCGNSSTDTLKVKGIYRLVANGQENEIKEFFKNVSIDELIKSDSGSIVRAINKLQPKDKVTHTIWILEEVKKRSVDIRRHVYTELEKVDYNRPSFLLKQLINNYFTNFNEKEVALQVKISALQRNMNK